MLDCGKFVHFEGHRCFIQSETKKRKTSHEVEEEEVPENGYDVSAFFDMECRQGKREPEDEPVEESLRELLCFFISSADKRTGTTNLIYVLFRTRLARNEFFKATILGTNSANGCSRHNMPIVRSWAMMLTLFSNIYANRVSSTMSS